jgi:hypothetical protein
MLSHSVNKIKLIAFRGESMVSLSGNFPRTFPSKSEHRQDGNPDGVLTTESMKETAMAKLVIPHYRTDSQICESPTIEIPLSKGYIAVVDECDADLADLRWHAIVAPRSVYGSRWLSGTRTNRQRESIHQVILSRILGRALASGELADHIDNNGLNNRRDNLRLATRTQNAGNSRTWVNNSSGYKGICFHKASGKYIARIKDGPKQRTIGYFATPEQAHTAYVEAAKLHFGEFANDGNGPVQS